MNTFMWSNPFTAKHLSVLEQLGIESIPPISKLLACGDTGTHERRWSDESTPVYFVFNPHFAGVGAMADVATIVDAVKARSKIK